MFAATVADQMLRLQTMPEGVEKAKIWKELRISLLALRRGALYARKLSIEEAKHAGRPPREGGDASPRRPWPAGPALPTIEERRRAIMERIGIDEGFDGSVNPELTLPENYGPDQNVGVSRSICMCVACHIGAKTPRSMTKFSFASPSCRTKGGCLQ
jgi:hypothetical protein